MKKSSGFVKKGKRDQDSDSSDDEGNTYFGEALAVVGNDETTKLGTQGDREAEVFQVSNDDAAVALKTGCLGGTRQLEERENTNTDAWLRRQEERGNVAEKKKVKESIEII
ncbi:hypothetical protein Tco_0914649 [Tanacetum coccineum]